MTINALIYVAWLAAEAVASPPAPPPVPPQVAPKVSWSGDLKLASLSSIDEALAQPLRDSIDVVMQDQSVRTIKTCKDLLAVSKAKFDLPPDHQSDIDWEALTSASIRCFALDALRAAKPATSSYVGWFRFSQAGVAKLPAGLAMPSGENEDKAIAKAEKKCKPWGKYDPRLKLHVDGTDDGQVSGDGWAGRVTVYARGDIDGDGIEDLMVYRYAKLNEGSENDETVFIITQTSEKGCPHVVRRFPQSLGSGGKP